MTEDIHQESRNQSNEVPQQSTVDALAAGTIVDEFGRSYPHDDGSSSLKRKANRIWNLFARAKSLNVVLTFIIAVSTVVQTCNAHRNNKSSSTQTDKLIAAAQMSAHSADHNAAAATSFAASAQSINQGIQDAVEKLNMQASSTKQLVNEALMQAQASKASAEVSRLAFEAESRPYVSVSRIEVGFDSNRRVFAFAPIIVNAGRVTAQNVSYRMENSFSIGDVSVLFTNRTLINLEPGASNTYLEKISDDKQYATIITQGMSPFRVRLSLSYEWRDHHESNCTDWEYDPTIGVFINNGRALSDPRNLCRK